MFERFTHAAREVVVEAQVQRRSLGHKKVRTEHLLLALLVDDGPGGEVLRSQGLDADRIATRLNETNAAADRAVEADDQLLEGLGIDIKSIRQSLDEKFGPGTLDRVRGRNNADYGKRLGLSAGNRRNVRFDSCSKRALELSLREALRLQSKRIGPEHIGLGILQEGQGVACRLLIDEGMKLAEVRSAWEALALGTPAR